MWERKEQPVVSPEPAKGPAPPQPAGRAEATERVAEAKASVIGRALTVKGRVSGSEDLHLDGELEGSVELPGHNLTVGPSGKVHADVVARNVTVHGSLNGSVRASEKIEIRATGSLLGDLTTAGITIEDGAYFKGRVDIVRPGQAEKKPKEPLRIEVPVKAAGSDKEAVRPVSVAPPTLHPEARPAGQLRSE